MNETLSYLLTLGEAKVDAAPGGFTRDATEDIDPSARLQVISGPRGVGKTTLLLQYARRQAPPTKAAYLSLDDLYFNSQPLLEVLRELVEHGYTLALLDEVHRYPNWSQELKNAYDRYPGLSLLATSSSALDLYRGASDLSRRADPIPLPPVSFRESCNWRHGAALDRVTWPELRDRHVELARAVRAAVGPPLPVFNHYLREGAYPAPATNFELYRARLRRTTELVVTQDIGAVAAYRPQTLQRLLQLLSVVAAAVPFTPNLNALAAQLEVSRNTLYQLFAYLDAAGVTRNLLATSARSYVLNKPQKVYLGDPNLLFALQPAPSVGTVRETFFAAAWPRAVDLSVPPQGDFAAVSCVFEVGGRGKGFSQVKDLANAYLAVDELEVGFERRIPLYLFGLLN